MPTLLLLLATVLFACASTHATADTYKCIGADGRTTYADHPCPAGESAWREPKRVDVAPLPQPDLSSLPKNAQGQPVLSGSGGAELVLKQQNAPSPINVLAACGALVTRCVKPGDRDLDACFMSAPRCQSQKPWEDKPFVPCCPQACWLAYKANRQANMPPIKAFDRALYGGPEGGCLALRD